MTFAVGIAAGITSTLVARVGFKPPLVAGPLLIGAGMWWLAHIPAVGGSYFEHMLPGLIIMAFGTGMSFVSVTIAATSGVPEGESGLASGLLNTAQ